MTLFGPDKHFGRAAPARHQARYATGLAKLLYVFLDLQRQVVLVLALLHVTAVELFYIFAVEGCFHWRNSRQEGLNLLQILRAKHPRLGGRLVSVVLENVPAAENQIL